MEKIKQFVKKCCHCLQEKPVGEFYLNKRGTYSSRCRKCHGSSQRVCIVCGVIFTGKISKKVCGTQCRKILRPQTFRKCQFCGHEFGPLGHLKQKFCSMSCKVKAQSTGPKIIRRTHRWARHAHSVLHSRIRSGHIIRPDRCEECGATGVKIEGAHSNYNEPLNVRWLCRPCHVKWDRINPKHATYRVCPEFPDRCHPDKDFSENETVRISEQTPEASEVCQKVEV